MLIVTWSPSTSVKVAACALRTRTEGAIRDSSNSMRGSRLALAKVAVIGEVEGDVMGVKGVKGGVRPVVERGIKGVVKVVNVLVKILGVFIGK